MRLLLAYLTLCLGLLPGVASAHLPGQPPFTYVNNEAALYYPINYTTTPDLAIPQDAAPDKYLVNTELQFKLDAAALPFFPEELQFYNFTWDFADGTTGSGLELRHTYAETGSKIITIYSQDSRTSSPKQVLSTLYVNVVPTEEYRLIDPRIMVNGATADNRITSNFDAPFNKTVTLSTAGDLGTAKIKSVVWDLGDTHAKSGSTVKANYDNLFSTVLPIARITDTYGIFVDATAQINNTTLPGPGATDAPRTTSTKGVWISFGVLTIIAFALFITRRSHE